MIIFTLFDDDDPDSLSLRLPQTNIHRCPPFATRDTPWENTPTREPRAVPRPGSSVQGLTYLSVPYTYLLVPYDTM